MTLQQMQAQMEWCQRDRDVIKRQGIILIHVTQAAVNVTTTTTTTTTTTPFPGYETRCYCPGDPLYASR